MTDVVCPQCGSPSVQAVPVQRKHLDQAVIAEYFLGTAAGLAAGSSTVIQAVCLKCGIQWFPGTEQERRLRALSGQMGEDAQRAEHERVALVAREKEEAARTMWKTAGLVAAVLAVVVVVAVWDAGRRDRAEAAAARTRDSLAVASRVAAALDSLPRRPDILIDRWGQQTPAYQFELRLRRPGTLYLLRHPERGRCQAVVVGATPAEMAPWFAPNQVTRLAMGDTVFSKGPTRPC